MRKFGSYIPTFTSHTPADTPRSLRLLLPRLRRCEEMPSSSKIVFAALLLMCMLALLTQQQLTVTHQTLREQLQQLPDQLSAEFAGKHGSSEDASPPPVQMASAGVVQQPHAHGARRHRTVHAVPSHVAGAATGAAPSVSEARALSTDSQLLGCKRVRRPYHVLLTAAAGIYQEWQTRIMYHHYKKLKEENPCSDVGGFTRLLNTPGAKPDGLMDEIPTVLVSQLQHGRCDECDHGFIVMNRPWGLRQLVGMPAFEHIEEDYIFIVETDHLLLKPLENTAGPHEPIGFGFYYMTYKYDPPKLKPVIAKYHTPEMVDEVGPSPIIIHKPLLKRMVDPWWKLCLTLKRDEEANHAFGWVLEMWGYALTMARLGVRHKIIKQLQAEPGGRGIYDLYRYYIYHYTFDLDSGDGGRFSRGQQKWAWSKRHYMAQYPPRISAPPGGMLPSASKFAEMINSAIDAIGDAKWRPQRARQNP